VVELDQDPQGKAIRAVMADVVGRTSVPAIWIEGTFIGGCNDGPTGGLLTLEEIGKLDRVLQQAGAI
jgi:glutaredoxin 3